MRKIVTPLRFVVFCLLVIALVFGGNLLREADAHAYADVARMVGAAPSLDAQVKSRMRASDGGLTNWDYVKIKRAYEALGTTDVDVARIKEQLAGTSAQAHVPPPARAKQMAPRTP